MPRTPTQDPRPRPPAIPTADAPLTPSKSHRKRDTHAFQVLGVQFVALSAAQLTRLALPKALHEAVVAAQRMRSHGAHPRQMQPIGKLMRQLEPAALSRIRAALTPGRADGEGLEPDHGGVTSPRPRPSATDSSHTGRPGRAQSRRSDPTTPAGVPRQHERLPAGPRRASDARGSAGPPPP